MHTLRIEHLINDFDTFKAYFETDPAERQRSGVLSYRIMQSTQQPNHLIIDLDFGSAGEAEAFLTRIRETAWESEQANPAILDTLRTQIVTVIEHKDY